MRDGLLFFGGWVFGLMTAIGVLVTGAMWKQSDAPLTNHDCWAKPGSRYRR